MRPLTISELENATGVPRGTIYFYLRRGLLPPPHKVSATRSLYDSSHVEILAEIRRLKEEGHGLASIRERVRALIEAAAGRADLAAAQQEETRRTILEAAARRFARQGYQRTRVVDVCADAGVTTQLLYSHFPSKRQLFIACYNVYFEWMRSQIAPHLQASSDPLTRMVWRVYASNQIQALSPDLQALARVETIHPASEVRNLLRKTYEQMMAEVEEDLAAMRKESGSEVGFDDELLAYALLGALENMQMRSLWDRKYDALAVIRNLLLLFAAVRAAYAGKVDLAADWQKVAPLAERVAARRAQELGRDEGTE